MASSKRLRPTKERPPGEIWEIQEEEGAAGEIRRKLKKTGNVATQYIL